MKKSSKRDKAIENNKKTKKKRKRKTKGKARHRKHECISRSTHNQMI